MAAEDLDVGLWAMQFRQWQRKRQRQWQAGVLQLLSALLCVIREIRVSLISAYLCRRVPVRTMMLIGLSCACQVSEAQQTQVTPHAPGSCRLKQLLSQAQRKTGNMAAMAWKQPEATHGARNMRRKGRCTNVMCSAHTRADGRNGSRSGGALPLAAPLPCSAADSCCSVSCTQNTTPRGQSATNRLPVRGDENA